MAAAKSWIVLTDSKGNANRINVAQINYYRRSNDPGTTVVFGGTSDQRVLLVVQETPEQIDEKIGGDFIVPT